ncbi:MAG: SDR family oxidoreductase [Candidatus Hydrogenedentes bacterium]|nr:SDR family oxidoreductase [Candidatus Hydrogenedentota bacterium]
MSGKPDLSLFDLTGKVAVITGGGGALGSAMARGLAKAGARCAITRVSLERAQRAATQFSDGGGSFRGYDLDVFQDDGVERLCEQVHADFGQVDILVNCVGGNLKEATTSSEQAFFDIPLDAIRKVLDLNFINSTVRPCQVFGRRMKDNERGGSIINISSMAAIVPLTRIVGYSAAKAAVNNFTQWLAVHLAKEYSTRLRVNGIAPGFFLTAQNEFLLTQEGTGELTARGETIIGHTPMGEFGEANDLVGTAIWLASDASRFVTGITVPVDGGFSAYSGV